MQSDEIYSEEFQANVKEPLKRMFFAAGFKNWRNKAERKNFRIGTNFAKGEIDLLDLERTWAMYDEQQQKSAADCFKKSLMATFKCVSEPWPGC